MGILGSITQHLGSQAISLAVSRLPRSLPLRGVALFSPVAANFALSLDNRTAAPVRLDSIMLRAFGHRSALFAPRAGISNWFQPLTMEILESDQPEHEMWWGLKDRTIPPYSRSMFGVGHQLLMDRVMDARRIEIVAVERNWPVWRYSIQTRLLRDAIRDSTRATATDTPEAPEGKLRID